MSNGEAKIIIPDNIKELVELLAINVHNKWMEQRIQEGWSYGSERNDTLKTHPCIVPYEQLPDNEKEYDRISAIETIKTIISLGFSITKEDSQIVTNKQANQEELQLFEHSSDEADLAERFEVAFNIIHACMKKNSGYRGDQSFLGLLNSQQKHFSLVAKYYDELRQYAKLRNAIVHEVYKKYEYIAVPHVQVVKEIEKIAELFSKPPSVLKIASKKVLYCFHHESVSTVINKMMEHRCTSVPIYQEKKFLGLLTEDGIIRWLSKQLHASLLVDFNDVAVSEILALEASSNVLFVSKQTTVVDSEILFSNHLEQGKKIEALIVTSNGAKDQYPLGIITSWDLIKIED